MNKLISVAAFGVGGAIGSVTTWLILKNVYAKQSNQDIASAKDAFRIREEKLKSELYILKKQLEPTEPVDENPEKTQTVLTAEKVKDKDDILEYAKGKYMQYYPSKVPSVSESADSQPAKRSIEDTYVISPESFGEFEDYDTVSLNYYADGILADDRGVIIDDIDEMFGDALEHFGEYEDDAVHCRNDVKRCDYEILKDLRRYADVRKYYPRNL